MSAYSYITCIYLSVRPFVSLPIYTCLSLTTVPARVTPLETTVVGCNAVFGGRYDAYTVMNATDFTICCPVEGFPAPNTTFHRLEVDSLTGLSREVLLNQSQAGLIVS